MTKPDQIKQILDIYLPKNFPNRGALERRLIGVLESGDE